MRRQYSEIMLVSQVRLDDSPPPLLELRALLQQQRMNHVLDADGPVRASRVRGTGVAVDGSETVCRQPPLSAGEAELQELFGTAGTVDTVKVMRDMATGRARGFAFVEMATDNDAQAAIDKLHNYEFGGRNLTVNEARPRPERSAGGGFGGGGGGRGGGGFTAAAGRRLRRWRWRRQGRTPRAPLVTVCD